MLVEELKNILAETRNNVIKAETLDILKEIKVSILGKKGKLTSILKRMGSLSAKERPQVGKLANEIRTDLTTLIEEYANKLEAKELENRLVSEKIDVTLPGKVQPIGFAHPLNIVKNEIEQIFIGMGFTISEGPEVELTKYNFDALNIPKDHVARDEQDTFYIDEDVLLRTHTSPVQIRTMEKQKPPIRTIAPGRVYRTDTVDATHSPLFHQIEGLVVDKGVSFSDLKGTLELFVKQLYGNDVVVRFRPHHFHFTEPSAELDMQCFNCKGEGCSVCKGEGWIEILGCGMVHPKVLSACNIDPEVYSGFAFGMGLERIVMRRYGINDLRLFFENDMRFLKQF